MEFNEIKEELINLIENDSEVGLLLSMQERSSIKTIKMMLTTLEKAMEEGTEKLVTTTNKRNVFNLSSKMLSGILINRLTPSIEKFIKLYSELVFNWGKAFEFEDISNLGASLDILNKYQESTVGMITAMQTLIRYCSQFESFNPPAFHVSKQYFDLLMNDIEDNKCMQNRNK